MRHNSFVVRLLSVCGIALAIAALTASPAAAQTGKLTGVVTDAATGQPIEGVQVVLQGTGYGGLTQANGRFFIIAIPPGTYTVTARRIGYQTTQEQTQILIDVTRTINFQLNPSTTQLQAVRVIEARAPLVELSQTGTTQSITAEELEGLPVRSIKDAITLQAGFQEVPLASTDLTSFTAARRVGTPSVLIRGGRSGETLTLIDGIPVSNFLFGGGALDITDKATQQIQTIKGGLEPQYGNALSGVVNIATKEGGTNIAGSIEYETSRFGGAVGSTRDDLRDYDFVDGYLSGPVPATENRLRFVVAGRTSTSAMNVMEYDDHVYDPFLADTANRGAYRADLIPGWFSQGYVAQRDIFGKLTYYFGEGSTTKLSLTGVDVFRETLNIPFDWRLTGYSYADRCIELYQERYGSYLDVADVCNTNYSKDQVRFDGRPIGDERFNFVTPAPIGANRRLYTARFEQTINRFNYKIVAGVFDQKRLTCSTFFSGVCIAERIADTNFNGRFVTPGVTSPEITPTEGTDEIAGNDRMRTQVARFDAQMQATDHHNIAAGLFYQRHDITFREVRDIGLNNIFLQPSDYKAQPWDAALYLQDRIEYDFLTVRLGARFDYGQAKGTFLTDPLDPTNGTTMNHVCEDPTRFGLPGGWATFTRNDTTFTGVAACGQSSGLRDSAVAIAFQDDMSEAGIRKAFSPRLGLGFPITDRSQAFFNFGVYYQNPLYNNVYQGTGIGTDIEGTPDAAAFTSDNFVGNPRLEAEKTVSYEMGYVAEFGRNYSMLLVAFSKDQSGLTGIRQGGFVAGTNDRVFDPGVTYGTNAPDYTILMNVDYQTVRGFELEFRRGLTNFWSYRLSYAYSQATNNAAPPDLEFQQTAEEGDIPARSEIRSDIDQRHSLGGVLRFVVRDQTPQFRFGEWLRNSSLQFTARVASGLPYTPTISFTGGGNSRLQRNSGTAPTTIRIDMQANKEFNVANVRYGAFVRVDNLLDRRNCSQVFTSTGNCERGATAQARLRAGNFTGESEGSTFFDRRSTSRRGGRSTPA